MNRPSFSSINIWAEWENDILSILAEALTDLSNAVGNATDENDITDCLHKILLVVRYKRNKIAFGSVVRQTQNQPVNAIGVPENELSLRKKPDLLWILNDENADNPEKSQRYFTIECKCLSTDIDDKNYIEKGVSRFTLDEWGYGRYEKSAAMVGYIKKNNAEYHLSGVNNYSEKQRYPALFEAPCGSNCVYRYRQGFCTREFEPQKFTLYHLWTHVDIHFNKKSSLGRC